MAPLVNRDWTVLPPTHEEEFPLLWRSALRSVARQNAVYQRSHQYSEQSKIQGSQPMKRLDYQYANRVALKPQGHLLEASFLSLLNQRRTRGDFNGSSVSLQDLSTLLHFSYGFREG